MSEDMVEDRETNLELTIHLRNDMLCHEKSCCLSGTVLKEHESGFIAEHYVETEPELGEEKHVIHIDPNYICSLEKTIENRHVTISPFGGRIVGSPTWCDLFKNDIAEFYKLINDKEKFAGLFKEKHSPCVDFHFGLFYLDKSLSRWNSETENCDKYRGWHFLMTEFPFEILGREHDDMLAKINAYRDYSYERENLIFFFEKFSVDIIVKIFNLYERLQILDSKIWTQVKEFEKQLLISEKVDGNIQTIINKF